MSSLENYLPSGAWSEDRSRRLDKKAANAIGPSEYVPQFVENIPDEYAYLRNLERQYYQNQQEDPGVKDPRQDVENWFLGHWLDNKEPPTEEDFRQAMLGEDVPTTNTFNSWDYGDPETATGQYSNAWWDFIGDMPNNKSRLYDTTKELLLSPFKGNNNAFDIPESSLSLAAKENLMYAARLGLAESLPWMAGLPLGVLPALAGGMAHQVSTRPTYDNPVLKDTLASMYDPDDLFAADNVNELDPKDIEGFGDVPVATLDPTEYATLNPVLDIAGLLPIKTLGKLLGRALPTLLSGDNPQRKDNG